MTNSPAASSTPAPWPSADISYATKELAQEFPTTAKEKVLLAVNSAAPFVELSAGRVQLMKKARELLRPSL